jgi:hypothetical protein
VADADGAEPKYHIAIPTTAGEPKEFVDREVTAAELAVLAENMAEIRQVSVSCSRRLATAKFEGEDVWEKVDVSFDKYWDSIPPVLLADPKAAREVHRGFGIGANKKIGRTLRQLYVTLLWCCLDRAEQLSKGPNPITVQSRGQLSREVEALETAESFDPFDSRGLRKKPK